jgi:hypothetical protein
VSYCTDCDELLLEGDGGPCPTCGSMHRTVKVVATATVGVSISGPVGLKITKGPDRSWHEKWLAVTDALRKIEDAYSQPDLSGQEIESRVNTFFVECDHLRDWTGDDAQLPNITKAGADTFMRSEKCIEIANALSNTHKHRTRARGMTARVSAYSRVHGGISAEVSFGPSGTEWHVDARTLARGCVAAWEAWFGAMGIQQPGVMSPAP